jgi:hypothetical protein
MISRFRTFIAGFLVLLPLAVTVAVIVWVGTFIYAYIGPDSAIGRILISIGFNFSNSPSPLTRSERSSWWGWSICSGSRSNPASKAACAV